MEKVKVFESYLVTIYVSSCCCWCSINLESYYQIIPDGNESNVLIHQLCLWAKEVVRQKLCEKQNLPPAWQAESLRPNLLRSLLRLEKLFFRFKTLSAPFLPGPKETVYFFVCVRKRALTLAIFSSDKKEAFPSHEAPPHMQR